MVIAIAFSSDGTVIDKPILDLGVESGLHPHRFKIGQNIEISVNFFDLGKVLDLVYIVI